MSKPTQNNQPLFCLFGSGRGGKMGKLGFNSKKEPRRMSRRKEDDESGGGGKTDSGRTLRTAIFALALLFVVSPGGKRCLRGGEGGIVASKGCGPI